MSRFGGIEPVAYDLKSAAMAVCMSDAHLRRQIHAGHLPARLVGHKYLILRRDLEEWVANQPEAPTHDNWRPRW